MSLDKLLYAGRINAIVGHSGSGKSMVGQLAVAEAIANSRHAIWIDYEDNAGGLHSRLAALGCSSETIKEFVTFISPEMALTDQARAKLTEHINSTQPVIVVIDSVGEAIASSGLKDDDMGVAIWYRTVPRFFADLGPAVLLIDHVVKDENAPKNFAIGSQRKRAAISGAMYRLDVVNEFAQGVAGKANLTVAKDRYGQRPVKQVAAQLFVNPGTTEGSINARLVAPGARPSKGERRPTERQASIHASREAEALEPLSERWLPTVIMERISEFLEAGYSKGMHCPAPDVVKAVRGSRSYKYPAIDALVEGGWVDRVIIGKTHHLASIKPYRDGDEKTFDDYPSEQQSLIDSSLGVDI